jgi:hypothetical protein
MNITDFRDVMPYCLASRYQCFGEVCCFHFQNKSMNEHKYGFTRTNAEYKFFSESEFKT